MAQTQRRIVLVVGAHPADPIDEAGGTIAKHAEAGDRVIVLSMTHGARSHAPAVYGGQTQAGLTPSTESDLLAETIKRKVAELQAACEALGAEARCLNLDDEPFIASREAILKMAECYREYRPDILITHHKAEMNHHDHPQAGEVSLRAATTAARWTEGSRLAPHTIPTVYFYGFQFRPHAMMYHAAIPLPATHVVNIESVIERKIKALRAFASQSYAGLAYESDEYLRKRIAAIEGNFGLVRGITYAEEFIRQNPPVCELLS